MRFLFTLCLQQNKVKNQMTTSTITSENRRIIANIYPKVRTEIYTIFRQACIDEDTCYDLVQDVFVKIMGMNILISEHIKGLAVRIAYQKRIDYLRQCTLKNRVHNNLSMLTEPCYSNTEVDMTDILQVEQRVMQKMSTIDSKIYQLIRFEDKTVDEIVQATGLTKRAVESRIFRTRIMVRKNVKMLL